MPADSLYELIRSMNAEEKRAFKIQAKKYSPKDGKKYLRLFDFFDGLRDYDAKKVKQALAHQSLGNQPHVTKAYLTEQLLEVLVRKYEHEDFHYDFQRRLAHADVLFAKGHYDAALKRVRKLSILAEQSGRPLLVLQAGQLIEKITIRLSDPELFGELLEKELVRQNKALQQHELYLHYRKISMQLIFLVSRQSASTLSKKQELDLKTIGNELRRKLPLFATSETAILRLGTLTLYHRYMDQLDPALDYALEALDLALSADTAKLSGGTNSLVNLYNNASMLLSLKGDMKRLDPLSRRVLAYPAKNKSERILMEERVNVSRLTQNIAFGRYDHTDTLVPVMEKFLAEHDHSLSHFGKTLIPYNIMCHYFNTGRFKPALKWLNKLVNYDFDHMAKYMIENILLIELLIHFELDNTDLLHSRLVGNEKMMYRYNTYSRLEETIILYLLRISKLTAKEQVSQFLLLRDECTEMKKDPLLVRRFGDFAYDLWIETHLTGKNIAKLSAEKSAPVQK
ncbi:MAG: hypothetical protein FD123_751 [Bacteroidetes bacterium]|nr:MAG: hypothetical protein FD123_751 [Bacteroidota bacterium]